MNPLTVGQLAMALDEADDMRVDETLGDQVLLELCVACWPTRIAQDN